MRQKVEYGGEVNMQQKGFTLIELMVVVAVVGILAAVAIPSYVNYTVRAKVSEAFSVIGPWKMEMQEYFFLNGKFPSKGCNSCIGMGTDGDCGKSLRAGTDCSFGRSEIGNYVKNIHIGGRVELEKDQDLIITFNKNAGPAANKRIALRAVNTGNTIQWVCSSMASMDPSALDEKYLPSNCKKYLSCPLCK